MMKDFPSCFGENGVQVADASSSSPNSVSKIPQNLVSCIYRSKFKCQPCLITVTWLKTVVGQNLTVSVHGCSSSLSYMSPDQCICKVEIKPWLFSKKRGCKKVQALDVYWDFWNAKFGMGPEPIRDFYVAIVSEEEVLLLLGDLKKEAYKRIEKEPPVHHDAVFVSKRANIVGKKCFIAKAQFCDIGRLHDVVIECDTVSPSDPSLMILIDGKPAVEVRRLKWKFRGNYTISVDGIQVEVYWDVRNWLFGNDSHNGGNSSGGVGNAVFMFKTCISSGEENPPRSPKTSVLEPWVSGWSSAPEESALEGLGFSVILHAWKIE